MKCDSCNSEDTVEAKHAKFFEITGKYIIIENVPCLKCHQCGEVFYKASVLEKIDEILEKIENIASKIFIMDYEKAA